MSGSGWVQGRLGVQIRTRQTTGLGLDLNDLASIALRRNPRRAHLLVSSVLGKHIPTDPRIIEGSARLLGLLVADLLADRRTDRLPLGTALQQALRCSPSQIPSHAASFAEAVATALAAQTLAPDCVVLGYAETATGLGHGVATALRAPYLHSTRRPVPGTLTLGGFEESHSHATSHLLIPHDPAFLAGSLPLVLVDDELTTGSTALNTIDTLMENTERDRYVIACLTDMRTDADRDRMATWADERGVRLDVVALAAGWVELPTGTAERAVALVATLTETQADAQAQPSAGTAPPRPIRLTPPWPGSLPEGGRHGTTPLDHDAARAAVETAADAVVDVLDPGAKRVLVLGTEELMSTPTALATALAARPGLEVRSSTTTRSPVAAVDEPGYPIRTALTFPAIDTIDDVPRFIYNVAPTREPGWVPDAVVLVVDPPADTPALAGPGSLTEHLARCSGRVVVVRLGQEDPTVAVPLRGPRFGSYPAEDVTWLLKDLSHVELEAPTEEREAAIQAGTAHYAESLPQEYQPTPAYTELFHEALAEGADRLAYAVGVVGEILHTERGSDLVLASLARAGTPVGILIRRWFAFKHGLDVPHYTLSIVRARGIDAVALGYLAARYPSENVVFVDGWTGKGAIVRELAAAVNGFNSQHGTAFDPDLAVLADPGRCARTFGTREDYLIPSACLNSTVSGLVSRTVLNRDLIGPGDFHGAKFYAELAPADVSNLFVDAVAARFRQVQAHVEDTWRDVANGDRTPTWAGWAAVEEISRSYGVGDVNFVKPGVGETTRVLLRRVPDKILVRPDALDDLRHVLLLAHQRGVPVEEVADLPYSCIGLIARSAGGEG